MAHGSAAHTWMMAALAALAAATAAPGAARAQDEQQALVDRSTLAAQEMLNNRDGTDAQSVLRRARAVVICPQVLRAGFLLGGQGGSCVLVARDGGGSWSAPAFYGMGGGSIGFQAGIQDAEVMLLIMSDRGLRAVMDSQFKLGADATATFADLGGGVEGATTAALRADIVGFTRSRGLYAGISLGGTLLSSKSDWNQAYYGRPISANEIVVRMEGTNPSADPLRQVLIRYGGQDRPPAPPALPDPVPLNAGPPGAGPSYAAPSYATPPRSAPVQQQPLPPRRY